MGVGAGWLDESQVSRFVARRHREGSTPMSLRASGAALEVVTAQLSADSAEAQL